MDAKKCDVCGEFYLPYNTEYDAVRMSDANRIYFVNEDSQTYHRFDVCPCCMNKFLDLFYDIQKRYGETDHQPKTSTIDNNGACTTCAHNGNKHYAEPCISCYGCSKYEFKGCV